MALEDGAVLGRLLSLTHSKADLPLALQAYQTCRRQRVARIVERSNLQQHLYHLHDGPEQEERDKRLQEVPTRPGEVLGWRDPELAPWLLQYDAYRDAEKHWAAVMMGRVVTEFILADA
jgi:salicylate hydroxylase